MHKTFHFALKDVLKNEAQMTKTRGEKVRINIFYMITIFSWKLIVGWGVITGVDKNIFMTCRVPKHG